MRADFEVKLPIGGRLAPTAVAHMVGEEMAFHEALAQLTRAGRWQAALLTTPLPQGPDGPITADYVDALNGIGGAVVRFIVSA